MQRNVLSTLCIRHGLRQACIFDHAPQNTSDLELHLGTACKGKQKVHLHGAEAQGEAYGIDAEVRYEKCEWRSEIRYEKCETAVKVRYEKC